MSFGVSVPPPADEKECPECGEPIPAQADMCWLCLRKVLKEDASTGDGAETGIQKEEPKRRRRKRRAPGEQPKRTSDATGWIVVGMLLLFLFAGLLFETPGLLIVLVVVIVLAIVRSKVATQKEQSAAQMPEHRGEVAGAEHLEPRQEKGIVAAGLSAANEAANALAIAMIVGVTFFATFCITCSAVLMGGMAIGSAFGESSAFELTIIVLCIGGGLMAAVVVANIVTRGLQTPKR